MSDNREQPIKSFLDCTETIPARPAVPDPTWPEHKIYTATSLTGVAGDVRVALRRETKIVETVVRRVPIKGCQPVMYYPAFNTGPDTHQELLPHQVYARDLREAATAASIFGFLSPASHGVGMEMVIGSGSGIPLVFFHRVPRTDDAPLAPPFLEEIPADSNPPYLVAISRMVRGLPLSSRPALVRYTDAYDLEKNFEAFWRQFGAKLFQRGITQLTERRIWWTHACKACCAVGAYSF